MTNDNNMKNKQKGILKTFLVVITIIAVLIAVSVTVAQADKTPPAAPQNIEQVAVAEAFQAVPAHLTVLFVGDSTSVGEPLEQYRKEFGRLLGLAGVPFDFKVEAHYGWTCAMWTNWMTYIVTAYQPDLTVIDCGTNDAANGWGSPTYDNNYSTLINLARMAKPTGWVIGTWIEYSAYRAPWAPWLQQEEAAHNDAVYRQTINRAGVIFPPANYQNIPEMYLQGSLYPDDPGGIHSTQAGNDIKGRQLYNAVRGTFVLPDIAPKTCGLMGGRPGYIPAYTPCQEFPQ